MIDIPTDVYILNNFFLTSSRFLFSIENLIGGYTIAKIIQTFSKIKGGGELACYRCPKKKSA